MTIQTKVGQSVLDVAMEHTGKAETFIHLMIENSISDLNFLGQLEINNDLISSKYNVLFFSQNDSPATGITSTSSQGSFSISFNQSFN